MAERRGRSDLVHIFLLVALESVLNRKGMLEVYVHTRNDKLITIDPKTRLPKNYPRFVGLMESLFEKGAVPSEESPLIILRSGYNISRCLLTIAHTKVVLLSNEGNRVNLNSYFKEREGDILCIIGGFSKGDFTGDLRSKPIDVISVFEDSLPVWTVASELIVNYERYLF